jgi:general secretion pathway protein G
MKTTKYMPKPRLLRRQGFTLIELVLVLSIIAILMAAVALNSKGFLDTAHDTTVQGDLQKIKLALTAYESSAGRAPTTDQGLDALVNKPTKPPIPDKWHPYLDEVPQDPWKQPYHYKYPASKSKKDSYDIWSVGPDGQDNTPDDIGNWKKDEPAK